MFKTPAILRSICLPAVLALLGALGCVDHNATGGTTLFVFDGGSSSVKIWADVNKVHDALAAGTAPDAPDRTITSSLLSSNGTMGWGGVVVDGVKNRLYLVSQTGTVVAITKTDTQNGDISSIQDIVSFTLGLSADHFASGVFGQAALDTSNDTLYVQETSQDGAQTHLWYLSNISNPFSEISGLGAKFTDIGDQFGSGLAAQGGKVYALFGGGNVVVDSQLRQLTGPRLRTGAISTFDPTTNVLIGANTRLVSPVNFGSLGFDNQNSALYVCAQSASPAILVFNQSQFTFGFNSVPARTLSDIPADLSNLRIISHPPDSDWLLGADSAGTPAQTGAGTNKLHIWKNPSGGGAAVSGNLTGVTEIRGFAIGGSN